MTRSTGTSALRRAAAVRGSLFAGFWVVLMPGLHAADVVAGVSVACIATWTSLRLLPPAAGHLRIVALLAFVPRFLWQSVVGGVDVARRAFTPRMPLRPGYVSCPLSIPPGPARNAFAAIVSLQPGTVPAGDDGEALVLHCLDVAEPVAAQIAEEERKLAAALIPGSGHA